MGEMWSWAHISAQGNSVSVSSWVCSCTLGWYQPLWYCVAKFAGGIPTWRLPAYGQVAQLVSEGEEVGVAQVEPGEVGVAWVSGAGRVGKRVRLNRHTLVFQGSVGVQSRSRIWKRLCIRVVASNDRIYFCS